MSNKLLQLALITLTVSYTYQACCADCVNSLKIDAGQFEGETALPAITVKTTPETTGFNETGICGAIWKAQGGTCCDQTTLIARNTAWKTRLANRYGKLKTGMEKLDEVVKKAGTLATFVKSKADALKSSTKTMPADDNKKAKDTKRVLAMSDADVTALERTLKKFDTNKDKVTARKNSATAQIEGCYKAITKLRVNSLCLRCSGNADQFFDATNLAYKVKSDTCKSTIKECGAVMGTLLEASQMYDALLKVKAALGQTVAAHIKEFPVTEDKATKWATCADDATACSNDAAQVSALCSDFTISMPSPCEDATRADESASLATSRLLSGRANFRNLAETASDGYGNLIIDNTVTVDISTMDSGDTDIALPTNTGDSTSFKVLTQAFIAIAAIVTILMN